MSEARSESGAGDGACEVEGVGSEVEVECFERDEVKVLEEGGVEFDVEIGAFDSSLRAINLIPLAVLLCMARPHAFFSSSACSKN